MAICQCMVLAFTRGWENDCYGEGDLRTGLQYARDLIEFEGATVEPFHGYDLREFIEWCERRLGSL